MSPERARNSDHLSHHSQNFSSVLQSIFNLEQPLVASSISSGVPIGPTTSPVDFSIFSGPGINSNINISGHNHTSDNGSAIYEGADGADELWMDTTLWILKTTIMITIMVAAIFGNLLVIASVMRHRKLR